MKAAEKPVTKSRILNHTKLEKYVYTQNIRARFARGKIYILISSLSLFLLKVVIPVKNVYPVKKAKNGKGHYLHINF